MCIRDRYQRRVRGPQTLDMPRRSDALKYSEQFMATLPEPGLHMEPGCAVVFEMYPPEAGGLENLHSTDEHAKGLNFLHPEHHCVIELRKPKAIKNLYFYSSWDVARRACWVEVYGSNCHEDWHKVINHGLIDSTPGVNARMESPLAEVEWNDDHAGNKYKYYKIQFHKPVDPPAFEINHGPIVGYWKVDFGKPCNDSCSSSSD
eukprot:TRINITY_DN1721_c0_g1_i1.p1 TRINITY_DN1721_c0_g1~~TRINITY_DN1721_c0_g1_i1.p1  ORF type:complete len:204 (-),score=44.80 TRINITY_DN1721_c0_g1_i1:277-888(-)